MRRSTVTVDTLSPGGGRMTTSGSASFTYDGNDRVYQRTENAATATFQYAGGEADPVTDGTSTYSRNGDQLLGVRNATTNLVAGTNVRGDVTHLYNPASASVTDTKVFDPFGTLAAGTGATPNRAGFQGDWTDPTTSQVWMGARWYSPANAAFVSRDRVSGVLRNPVSLNRYTYAGNNPNRYVDPSGNCSVNINGTMTDYDDSDPMCAGAQPVEYYDGCTDPGMERHPACQNGGTILAVRGQPPMTPPPAPAPPAPQLMNCTNMDPVGVDPAMCEPGTYGAGNMPATATAGTRFEHHT